MVGIIAGVFAIYEFMAFTVSTDIVATPGLVACMADFVNCTVLTALTLIVVTAAVVLTRRCRVRWRIFTVTGSTLLTAVVAVAASMLWFDVPNGEEKWYVAVMTMALIVAGMVYAVNILVYDIDSQYRHISDLNKRNSELQLNLLQAYVNPHFLFNSLNTIGGLVYESPEKAERYIDNLSALLRYMLQNRTRRTVSVGEELRNLMRYVDLMHVRFGDDVRVEIDTHLRCKHFYLCPGTLQLIVENAIKHNAHSSEHPLVVRIDDDADAVRVSNNLAPLSGVSSGSSTGVGFESIDRRLSDLGHGRIVHGKQGGEYVVMIPKLSEEL